MTAKAIIQSKTLLKNASLDEIAETVSLLFYPNAQKKNIFL
jgi:hypothetical protein